MRGLSLVAASGGHSSSWCAGLSLSRPLLWSTSSRRTGSVVVAHGPSCSAAHGIFPDQGSNPRPLHWQADSQPLCHQGSLKVQFLKSLPGWASQVFFVILGGPPRGTATTHPTHAFIDHCWGFLLCSPLRCIDEKCSGFQGPGQFNKPLPLPNIIPMSEAL